MSLSSVFYKFRARQNTYSVVSSLVIAVIALNNFLDYPVYALEWRIPLLLLIAVSGILFAALPLIMGRGYPRPVAAVTVAFSVLLSPLITLIAGAEIVVTDDLLLLPLTAFYFGWFFIALVARIATVIIASLFALGYVASFVRDADEAIVLALINCLVVSLFCLEVTSYLQRRLIRNAATDELTGALNRRGLSAAIKDFRGAQTPLTIVVIDFDGFKEINDTRGHAEGDRVLRESVFAWRRHLRPGDVIVRRGGDEFLLVLPDVDDAKMQELMVILRAVSVGTWSWGAAVMQPDADLETVIHEADLALYRDKTARSDATEERP